MLAVSPPITRIASGCCIRAPSPGPRASGNSTRIAIRRADHQSHEQGNVQRPAERGTELTVDTWQQRQWHETRTAVGFEPITAPMISPRQLPQGQESGDRPDNTTVSSIVQPRAMVSPPSDLRLNLSRTHAA